MSAETSSVSQAVIRHRAALRAVDAALTHAESLGAQVCVSVVDSAGREVAFARMPGAFLIAGEMARRKAHSTASIGVPADVVEQLISHEGPHVREGIVHAGLCLVRGGLPLQEGGALIGAVGVSGASEAQDVECAQAAVAALQGK